jgi:hypothetical protein
MMTRYLSGLCVAGLGLCAGSGLVVAAVAFDGQNGRAGYAHKVNLATGAGLILVSAVTLLAWALAWRRRLRAQGVLAAPFHPVSRRAARRNRRRLAREVRHAAWVAKRADRKDRKDRRPGAPAVAAPPEASPFTAEQAGTGPAGTGPAGTGPAGTGPAGTGHAGTGPAGTGPAMTGPSGTGAVMPGLSTPGAGHDGASSADVLSALRALLNPLLTAATADPLTAAQPWPPSCPPQAAGPARPSPAGAGPLDGELRRIADAEEA